MTKGVGVNVFNLRTDAYGGSAERRAKFLLDILGECRKVVPANFCIGVKFKSADHSTAYLKDSLTQIGMLVEAGIDFLEVRGGTYENPRVCAEKAKRNLGRKSVRTAAREAFFLEFAKETRKKYPDLRLMLTGGFRSRAGAEAAIQENACDLVGIACPAAVNPHLPNLFLQEDIPDKDAQITLNKVQEQRLYVSRVSSQGTSEDIITNQPKPQTYYSNQISRLAKGLTPCAPD
ncbi:uncharacterized protein N7477_006681, partial [Penicillium maclennaniae]|uniref:uncharacterized protein n=1 Tax=Penicillium maclennaniae TaxID=1343394 RepID=UPI0025419C5F